MGQFKGTGSVSTLGKFYDDLDGTFKDHINGIINKNVYCSCLLRLLRLPKDVDALTPLLSVLMGYYDQDKHFFYINGNQLNVTLEDVLYVTGLPIKGLPVISATSRDPEAFKRVFGDKFSSKTKLKVIDLKGIAKDTTQLNDTRLVALLLIIVSSFIIPSSDGPYINSCYVQFVEHLERVNEYAWGAALLAFLYHGLDNKKKNSQDGNLWVLSVRHNCSASFVNCYLIIIYHFNRYFLVFILQCFFCFRIPELSKSVGYDIPSVNLQAPLLMNYMEKLQRVSKNHRTGYQQKIERLLTTLEFKVSGSFYISLFKYVNLKITCLLSFALIL